MTDQIKHLYSHESESAILSSMLCYPNEVIDDVSASLTAEDFFVPSHKELFKIMCFMKNRLQAIDIPTVHQALVDAKLDESLGSPGILAEMASNLATHLNISSYIKIVKEKSTRRNIKLALAEIHKALYDEEETEKLVAFSEQRLGQAVLGATSDTTKTAAQVANTLRERLNEAIKRRGQIPGISTGYAKLDAITGGWQPGKVILIAGRPGDGKSVCGENFLFNTAVAGFPCATFTLEMDGEEHGQRTIAHESQVSTIRQNNGDVTQEEYDGMQLQYQRLGGLPIFYEDCSNLNILMLKSRARRLAFKFGLKLIVVDYLTLVDSTNPKAGEMEKIREVLRGIKTLSRELKIPIIVLAQLNRSGAKDAQDGEVELHHIRSAGEDDPDTVILLQRQKERTPNQIERDIYPTRFKIAKNRGGPTGYFETLLDAVHNKFHAA